MKCPKCDYLGFETGDRCRNCGYDFSLLAPAAAPEPELPLRDAEPFHKDPDRWLNQLEARLDVVHPVTTPSGTSADPLATLPLFQREGESDEPLIKMPAAPRAPLSVRRTPERPRFRTAPKPVRKTPADVQAEPVLAFADESIPARPPTPRVAVAQPAAASSTGSTTVATSGPVRRIIAGCIDLVILLGIDAIVVYFTFQIAGLPFSEWRGVPFVPLALFLLLVKGAYFSVFTTLGGQTVGKMATGIRVVADDHSDVEPSRALQRTLATLASVATVGIGFAPVLFAGDRRALHDRVAGTRVVGPFHG